MLIILYWNLSTGLVTPQMYTRSPAQVQAQRGEIAVQVVLMQGTPLAEELLPAGSVVGIVVRDPVNLGSGYLAGPSARPGPAPRWGIPGPRPPTRRSPAA